VTSLDSVSKYLLNMELRFDAVLCLNLGNENSDAGHIKCSRGPQVPHHWFRTNNCYSWKYLTQLFDVAH